MNTTVPELFFPTFSQCKDEQVKKNKRWEIQICFFVFHGKKKLPWEFSERIQHAWRVGIARAVQINSAVPFVEVSWSVILQNRSWWLILRHDTISFCLFQDLMPSAGGSDLLLRWNQGLKADLGWAMVRSTEISHLRAINTQHSSGRPSGRTCTPHHSCEEMVMEGH